MAADLSAALDQIADNTQARTAYRRAHAADLLDGEGEATAAALAALVLAAHARHHDGAARWCPTEACRAADAITHGEAYL